MHYISLRCEQTVNTDMYTLNIMLSLLHRQYKEQYVYIKSRMFY